MVKGLISLAAVGLLTGAYLTQDSRMSAIKDDSNWVAVDFDAKGGLYAADANKGRIIELTLDEKKAEAVEVKVDDLADRLAKALGAEAGKFQINDIAVHPVSHAVFVAAQGGIVRVGAKGEATKLDLSKAKVMGLPKGCTALDLVVTPKGLVVSSMKSDKSWTSRLHAIALPLKGDTAPEAETELYHVTHGAWETEAPLNSMTWRTVDGKEYIYGSTMCTPVVRLPLDEVFAKKEKIKLQTICELGGGMSPMGMAIFSRDKKETLLVAVDGAETGTFKVEPGFLTESAALDKKAADMNQGKVEGIALLKGWEQVHEIAVLDDKRAVVLKGDGAKAVLASVELP